MAVIEKRKTQDGKTHYRVKVRLKGYPSQTSTHERLADAKRWAAETEASIREGRHFKTAEAKKHTLGELIDRYIRDVLPQKKKSQKKQSAQLLWWKDQIGHHLLSDLSPSLIAECRDRLANGTTYRGAVRSPSTVIRYIAALSHALTVAVKEWGWIDDNPIRKVSKPKEARGRVRFLEQEGLVRLLQICKESKNPYLFPIVKIALATGMRFGEIINLNWNQVDMLRKLITLHETKNGDRRAVPLSSQALSVFADLQKSRPPHALLVFPRLPRSRSSRAAELENPSSLSREELEQIQKSQKSAVIRSAWEQALIKAEIDDFRFHDLRHCAASYLAMSGASLSEIAEILGHKTLAMVKRYAHLSDTHKHAVIDRMNKNFLELESL